MWRDSTMYDVSTKLPKYRHDCVSVSFYEPFHLISTFSIHTFREDKELRSFDRFKTVILGHCIIQGNEQAWQKINHQSNLIAQPTESSFNRHAQRTSSLHRYMPRPTRRFHLVEEISIFTSSKWPTFVVFLAVAILYLSTGKTLSNDRNSLYHVVVITRTCRMITCYFIFLLSTRNARD